MSGVVVIPPVITRYLPISVEVSIFARDDLLSVLALLVAIYILGFRA
jgi:hypothetical protein